MEIHIKHTNIDHVCHLANASKKAMSQELGADQHTASEQLTPIDFDAFFAKNNIRVIYWDFSSKRDDIEALMFDLAGKGQLILVNEQVLSLPPSPRTVYIKSLFCHELAHIVHQHSGAGLTPENPTKLDVFIRAVWTYAPYLVNAKEREMSAEVFAVALGFWPHSDFIRLFKRSKADFRFLANLYKMPVDCAVKWALIQFHDQLKMHYVKREEGSKNIVDHYGPGLMKDVGIDLFSLPWTSAYKAAESQDDVKCLERAGDGEKYSCVAFYEKKQAGFHRTCDKILVAGFSRQEFESFCM
jgi:hypothetical protein